MASMIIASVLIVFLLGSLFGIALAQAAGKEMPEPNVRRLPDTYHTKPPKGIPGPVDAEATRQAIKDADERELWDE